MQASKEYLKDMVIYQVYPRSFYDSNGDGIGDLPGVLQKLDYLHELGVNAIWLSPVFKSPNADNGYDISDYRDIMDEFGTMEDWEKLKAACAERGIKIIMDLVVNHSSDEHKWFEASRASKDGKYSDFYIWRDPVDGKPPNNWASVFGGSAWEYAPERGQYYMHLFSKKQPDLNWACDEMRGEIYDMIRFWAQKGVDGLRVDAISYLDKPADFPDSPEPLSAEGYADCIGLLQCRPQTHAYIREMHDKAFEPCGLFTVGEVSAPTVEELVRYVSAERREFDMAIPFVPPIVEIQTWSPAKLLRDAHESYKALAADGWWARFLSNHDKPRQVSLYGNDSLYWEPSAKLLAMLLHTLPGTPFIYQGEELGMTNVSFESIDDYDDPDTKNRFHQLCLEGHSEEEALATARLESRDNARSPMQWDDSENGGFTTGHPWIGVNPNYTRINAEAQVNDPHSIYSCYKKLIALRKSCAAISRGDFEPVRTGSDTLLSYRRSYENETLLAVHNFSAEPAALPEGLIPEGAELLLTSYDREGGERGGINEELRPYESMLILIK